MSYYVYSTLAANMEYTTHHRQEVMPNPAGGMPRISDVPRIDKVVKIKGGANVAPAGIRRLETPLGVMTNVTEEEAEILKNHPVGKIHIENGYIVIRKGKVDPEVAVASGMEARDESAPMVEGDMVKVGNLDEDSPKKQVKATGRFNKTALKNTLQ